MALDSMILLSDQERKNEYFILLAPLAVPSGPGNGGLRAVLVPTRRLLPKPGNTMCPQRIDKARSFQMLQITISGTY